MAGNGGRTQCRYRSPGAIFTTAGAALGSVHQYRKLITSIGLQPSKRTSARTNSSSRLFAAIGGSAGAFAPVNRLFGWAETLTLYAILVHRIHQTNDFPRRLRVLRNLLEASGRGCAQGRGQG